METQPSPKIQSFLPTIIILMVLGWGGLFMIMNYTSPNGGTRWAFFFTLILALTGTSIPITIFINRYFRISPPVSSFTILRQSLWAGFYLSLILWLQIGQVLSAPLAFFLALALAMIEWLLHLRDRSQWKA